MSNNISMIIFWSNPAVPHHLHCIKCIFRYAHRISNTTCAEICFATPMGIGIREYDLRSTCINTTTSSRAFKIIIIPRLYLSYGKHIHIVIIVRSCSVAIKRTISLLVIRIAVFIPILAQSLVTIIFHHPHRMLAALVNI